MPSARMAASYMPRNSFSAAVMAAGSSMLPSVRHVESLSVLNP